MLPKLEGFAAARLGSLDATALAAVVDELAPLEQTVLGRRDLRAVLTDTSIARDRPRGLILADLLNAQGRRRDGAHVASTPRPRRRPRTCPTLRRAGLPGARQLAHDGTFTLPSLGLLGARRRVGGFADALLDEVETVALRRDRGRALPLGAHHRGATTNCAGCCSTATLPLESRIGDRQRAARRARSPDVTLRLARFVIEGGRPRDVVGTLDYLVDYVAKARDWRVARVHTARPLDDAEPRELVASLTSLTGKNVELQVAEEPDLLGGVLVEVGDLRLDATTRGRLECAA